MSMQGSKNSFFTRTEKRAKFDDIVWSDQSYFKSKKIDANKEARRKVHRENIEISKANKMKF